MYRRSYSLVIQLVIWSVGHTVVQTRVVLLRRIVNRLVGRSIICQSSGRYLIPLSVRYCTSVGNLFLVITAAIVRYCSRVRVIVVIPLLFLMPRVLFVVPTRLSARQELAREESARPSVSLIVYRVACCSRDPCGALSLCYPRYPCVIRALFVHYCIYCSHTAIRTISSSPEYFSSRTYRLTCIANILVAVLTTCVRCK